MIKVDLKDAYFDILSARMQKNSIMFHCEGNLYKLMGRCFDLGPVSPIFTKLLKTLIAL